MPDVIWKKNGELLDANNRNIISCDDRSVVLRLKYAETTDAGQYSCFLANPVGESECSCVVEVQKTYQKPFFLQR